MKHSLKNMVHFGSAFVILLSANLSSAEVNDCSLFVKKPVIAYYASNGAVGSPSTQQDVNENVLSLLGENGLKVQTSPDNLMFQMNTEVRCGPVSTFFGTVDYCQTEVKFISLASHETIYTSGPTMPSPGRSIDFNSISWPTCDELKEME